MGYFGQLLSKAAGKVGGAIDKVGKATGNRLPELGISENLQAIPQYYAQQPQKKQTPPPAVASYTVTAPTTSNDFGPNGKIDLNANVNPSTGGQSAGGGQGNSGGGVQLNAPTSPQPDQAGDLALLRDQYNAARSEIEGQNSTLDQTYNLSRGDIEAGITDAEKAAESQKQGLQQSYGDILKTQLKTYQDQGRQRAGTYSALGTLDSSAYGEDTLRADQSLADARLRTDLEQTRSVKSVDDQVNTYKQKASSELARLGQQYQQGKQAIQRLVAQNRLEEAGSIRDYLSQVREQAANVQNSLNDFVNQAALLKAQGIDVRTNIGGVSASPYADQVNQQLSAMTQTGNSKYTIPTTNVNGQGYIPTKKKNTLSDFISIG